MYPKWYVNPNKMISIIKIKFIKSLKYYKIIAAAFLLFLLCFCKKKAIIEVIPTNNEPAEFLVSVQNISSGKKYAVHTFPDIQPDNSVSIMVNAPIGTKFSFISKLKHSNDVFFAPPQIGIPLYSNNIPIPSGTEVNSQVKLWDCGIFKNTDLVASAPDPINIVSQVGVNKDGFYYPDINQMISVVVEYQEETKFKITISNLGASASLASGKQKIVLQNGLLILHSGNGPTFAINAKAGDNFRNFIKSTDKDTSYPTELINTELIVNQGKKKFNLLKGIWCVHNAGSNPLYTINTLDYKLGLKNLAENGVTDELLANFKLATGIHSLGIIDSTANGKKVSINYNEIFHFKIKVRQGDHFSFASKLQYSPDTLDVFYSFPDAGIIPYNNQGQKLNGDVTSRIGIYDVGNGKNTFQPKDIDKNVHLVNQDRNIWPAPSDLIRVTIKPIN